MLENYADEIIELVGRQKTKECFIMFQKASWSPDLIWPKQAKNKISRDMTRYTGKTAYKFGPITRNSDSMTWNSFTISMNEWKIAWSF